MYLQFDLNNLFLEQSVKLQTLFSLLPKVTISGIIEMLIIAYFIYKILRWVQTSRAWILLRGIVVILAFVFISYICNFTVILWVLTQVASITVIAVIVIFQAELRSALEKLGKQNFFAKILPKMNVKKTISEKTFSEISRACFSMSLVKTGALIVIAQNESLEEIEKTGIKIDGIVTSQLLINIFEKNTPLHDGAVLIIGDKVRAATCYLPLTNSIVPKEYGTRHRAALGMSEKSDALVLVVSEETGHVSLCSDGKLVSTESEKELNEILLKLYSIEDKKQAISSIDKVKGWLGDEKVSFK
ncbi:MAG: diadenylate cyclase CdaA [Eubacteriales bacterium]|nr:diadenylate cyclase CdaA [Eubacteriales bacterium]